MTAIETVLSPLAWLGRQGTRALIAIIFLAMAIPPIGELLRPLLTFSIYALLAIAFTRVDLGELRRHLRRPWLVLAATAWLLAAVPAALGGAMLLGGVDADHPELYLAIMLQGMASPLISAPAFATLVGLDATLVLLSMVAATVAVPLTATALAALYFGPEVAMAPLALGLRLALLLLGAALTAAVLRALLGRTTIQRHSAAFDGVNVILLYVFLTTVMGGVAVGFWERPLLMAATTVLAFAVYFAMFGATTLFFLWSGRERALSLGFMTSQRNMGLMLGATGGVVPDLSFIYFALAQFPMYLTPHLLKPVLARLRRVSARPSPPR